MMERTFETLPGKRLYECNPELNIECDKRICKYNINAVEYLCHGTQRKEFSLKIGQVAAVKDYTPGLKKTRFNFEPGDRWVASTIPRKLAHDKK